VQEGIKGPLPRRQRTGSSRNAQENVIDEVRNLFAEDALEEV